MRRKENEMEAKSELTAFEEDILKEVANTGAGNAATSLANLLKHTIKVYTAMAAIVKLSELPEIISPKEVPAIGSYTSLSGDLKGIGLVYVFQEDALLLSDLMAGRQLGTTKVLTEEDRFGLSEAGLILTSPYLRALSSLSGLTVLPSVPKLFYKRTDQIASSIMAELSGYKEKNPLICVRTQLIQKQNKLGAFILFFLESSSWQMLLKLLKEKTR